MDISIDKVCDMIDQEIYKAYNNKNYETIEALKNVKAKLYVINKTKVYEYNKETGITTFKSETYRIKI